VTPKAVSGTSIMCLKRIQVNVERFLEGQRPRSSRFVASIEAQCRTSI